VSAAVGKEMYRQWWFFIAALLFIVAVVERVYGIDRQSLWSDELYAVIASYKPFAGAWKMMVDDSHPPGYLSFMYATLPITGYSDFGVRLHALLFGLLWTPLVFWLTRRWFSMQAALLASAVIASAYNAVYYSQEARAYSMLMVFNILNIFVSWRFYSLRKPVNGIG
jgi:mannosyltransferase